MRSLELALPPYPGVAMIALGSCHGREKDPRMEVAIYGHDLDPGADTENRLTGEATVGCWRARIFNVACGCGVIIEAGHLSFTRSGLQGFIGKKCTVVQDLPSPGDVLLIVWRETPHSISQRDLDYIAHRLGGLQAAFV